MGGWICSRSSQFLTILEAQFSATEDLFRTYIVWFTHINHHFASKNIDVIVYGCKCLLYVWQSVMVPAVSQFIQQLVDRYNQQHWWIIIMILFLLITAAHLTVESG